MVTSLSSQLHVAKGVTWDMAISETAQTQLSPGILKLKTQDQGYLHKPKSKRMHPLFLGLCILANACQGFFDFLPLYSMLYVYVTTQESKWKEE